MKCSLCLVLLEFFPKFKGVWASLLRFSWLRLGLARVLAPAGNIIMSSFTFILIPLSHLYYIHYNRRSSCGIKNPQPPPPPPVPIVLNIFRPDPSKHFAAGENYHTYKILTSYTGERTPEEAENKEVMLRQYTHSGLLTLNTTPRV